MSTNLQAVRQARVYLRDSGKRIVPICCLSDIALNFDNTEALTQKTHDGCTIRKVNTRKADISYNVYSLDNAEILSLLFPDGNTTQVAGTPVTGATQILSDSTYSIPTTVSNFYMIQNRNANNTAVTVTSVVGSVDGTLTAGTDYNIVTKEECLPSGQKVTFSYLEIPVTTGITTNLQDLTVTYNYTPTAEFKFTFKTGSFQQDVNQILIMAENKNDSTDIITIETEGTFEFSGPIFQFGDPKAELSPIGMKLVIPEDTDITISGIKETATCPCD